VEDLLIRFFENLGGRVGGPMTFRFVLQPLVAAILAIRAGLRDAQAGRPPYLWTILTSRQDRRHLLREGWRTVLNVFTVAVIIDLIYQLMEFRWVYPLETLLVAFGLACVPYVLLRGPANRIARSIRQRHLPQEEH